jgi:hypothetical protein
MKTKFLLTLLAFSGLFFGANSVSARMISPTETSHNIANLSRTISESIGFDSDTHSLVEFAINRALGVKKIAGDTGTVIDNNQGGIMISNPNSNQIKQTIRNKVKNRPIEQPFILGEIATPRNQSKDNIVNPDPAKTKDPTVTPIEQKIQAAPTNEDPLKRESIEK